MKKLFFLLEYFFNSINIKEITTCKHEHDMRINTPQKIGIFILIFFVVTFLYL